MFMEVIPTYKVTWGSVIPDSLGEVNQARHGFSFRVSHDDLQPFIRILLFNNVGNISIEQETIGGYGNAGLLSDRPA